MFHELRFMVAYSLSLVCACSWSVASAINNRPVKFQNMKTEIIAYFCCNCNCNLFAVHKSKLGYSPVDIDIVTYMPSNIIYIESE